MTNWYRQAKDKKKKLAKKKMLQNKTVNCLLSYNMALNISKNFKKSDILHIVFKAINFH